MELQLRRPLLASKMERLPRCSSFQFPQSRNLKRLLKTTLATANPRLSVVDSWTLPRPPPLVSSTSNVDVPMPTRRLRRRSRRKWTALRIYSMERLHPSATPVTFETEFATALVEAALVTSSTSPSDVSRPKSTNSTASTVDGSTAKRRTSSCDPHHRKPRAIGTDLLYPGR